MTTSGLLFCISLAPIYLGLLGATSSHGSPSPSKSVLLIIDVRTNKEFNKSHLVGATQIEYGSSSFIPKVSQLDKNKSYLLYCNTGGRAKSVANYMRTKGFTQVENMGGISEAAAKLSAKCQDNSASLVDCKP